MDEVFRSVDAFLLGRRTDAIFAASWPKATDPTYQTATKLSTLPKDVASTTLKNPEWANTTVLEGDVAEAVEDTVARRYAFWSALGGGMMYGWRVFNDRRELDLDLAQRWIAAFRALRHLTVGDFYPLLPHTNSETEWLASQYHRPDLGEGLIVAFRRRHAQDDTTLLRPRAIDPGATYALAYQSAGTAREAPGRDLAAGLTLELGAAPSHEVLHYRRR